MTRYVKRCPGCGETVSATALRCRYCPHRFRTWTIQVWATVAVVAVATAVVLALS